jgi:dsRNA-specific ribonuclease
MADKENNVLVDPIVALCHHYQQHMSPPVTVSKKKHFVDFNDCPTQVDGRGGEQWWRSEFHCPVSSKVFHTSLPRDVWLSIHADSMEKQTQQSEENQETEKSDSGTQVCEGDSGVQTSSSTLSKTELSLYDDFLIYNGSIYFKLKKAAQRSAAHTALEVLLSESQGVEDGNKEKRTMFRSTIHWKESENGGHWFEDGTNTDGALPLPTDATSEKGEHAKKLTPNGNATPQEARTITDEEDRSDANSATVSNGRINTDMAKHNATDTITTQGTLLLSSFGRDVPEIVLSGAKDQARPKPVGYVPRWLRLLHEAGLSLSSVTIYFTEVMNEQQHFSDWSNNMLDRRRPFLFRCSISYAIDEAASSEKKKRTFVGDVRSSKMRALESASVLVFESIKSTTKEGHTKDNHEPLCTDNHIYPVKKLKSRIPARTKYVIPLLPCFNTPLEESSTWHLYRLEFSVELQNATSDTKIGTSAMRQSLASFLGFDDYCATPLGILFPCSIEPGKNSYCDDDHSLTFKAEFSVPKLESDDSHVIVTLTDHSIIQKSEWTKEVLGAAINFNRGMEKWKLYGLPSSCPFSEKNTNNTCNSTGADANEWSPADRTYLMVPLKATHGSKDEVHTSMPYAAEGAQVDADLLLAIHHDQRQPLIRCNSVTIRARVLSGLCTVILCWQGCRILAELGFPLSIICLLGFTVLLPLLYYLIPGSPTVERGLLSHRFLAEGVEQKVACDRIYVFDERHNLLVDGKQCIIDGSNDYLSKTNDMVRFEEKAGLKLEETSYLQYYKKRFGICIRHPRMPLIPLIGFENGFTHRAFDPTLQESDVTPNRVLKACTFPEVITVLPMPRDIIYLFQYQATFMAKLEARINMAHFEASIRELGGDVVLPRFERVAKDNFRTGSNTGNHASSFNTLLTMALTLRPTKTYERLEFLGDAVLLHYTTMNLFSKSFQLLWTFDDQGLILAEAVRNKELCKAAARIGLHVGAITDPQWQSLYHPTRTRAACLDHGWVEHSDSTLSDIAEAILGAIFAAKIPGGQDSMAVGYLNELNIPLRLPNSGELVPVRNEGDWFSAHGSCVKDGYPFRVDIPWTNELINVGTITCCAHEVSRRLNEGCQRLTTILSHSSGNTTPKLATSLLKLDKVSDILFTTALFDDSLDQFCDDDISVYSGESMREGTHVPLRGTEVTSNYNNGSVNKDSGLPKSDEPSGLVRVAMLRDCLFHVGNSAMYCMISHHIFHTYEGATAGDLHLLKTCMTTDDVLVYMMIKAGFHACLYDKEGNDEKVEQFRKIMSNSDETGKELWRERGGWLIPGGMDSFRSRSSVTPSPRYYGLAGGQLLSSGKRKLPKDMTEDLAFSTKCIIGALALSFGLERTWILLFPFFEETSLLSADEMRLHCSNFSSLCSTYKKGNDASLK